jgi:hypothetical protein
MTDLPGGPADRPRPTPRPRPGAAPRPTPRPRVAGSRRDRDDAAGAARTDSPTPAPRAAEADEPSVAPTAVRTAVTARPRTTRPATSVTASTATSDRRRVPALLMVLVLLCVLAATAAGWLLWQRLNPTHVNSTVFSATRAGIEAVFFYDYEDSEGSIEGKLDALTGDLREQYEKDLSEGGIIDSYEQVSATTRYEVLDIGLQRINEAQNSATLVVFGQYVVESVNSGNQEAPAGSECQVTPGGAQACQQTLRVDVDQVDGEWKISDLVIL